MFLRNRIIVLIAGCSIFTFSCKNNSTIKESSNERKKKDVIADFKDVSDSLSIAWSRMISSDDNKINDIKRLIEEISYTKSYNVFLLDSVKQLQSKLLAKRYDQISMKNSELITQYDNATDSLISMVFRLAKTTPNIEQYQTAMQLVQDISAADNEVVLYRVRYDAWVRTYNELMIRHGKEISSKIPQSVKQERYYLFSLND